MKRMVGTTVRGIRAPIIKEGDDLVNIVVDCVIKAAESENFSLRDRDVVGITESLLSRAQGNYASIDDVAADINEKFSGAIGVIFPILSRNRFANIFKGIVKSGKKIYLFLNYPSDEVGNHLMDPDMMYNSGVNPYTDILSEDEYRKIFGKKVLHPFTGVDYVEMYRELAGGDNIKIYLTNDPRTALKYTKEFLVANIHERFRTKKILLDAGAEKVYSLDEILSKPVNGSGFNPDYGLLGSNMATDNKLKLFPRDCEEFVYKVQSVLKEKTGKHTEVMIYGDGAFKDPVGKIWELADPVVSPGYTEGLNGTPNEIKIKYVADNELNGLQGEDLDNAMKRKIEEKSKDLVGSSESLGTTPRRITDLIGSLCDLTSGSGDKGTPIVLIQGYFDNYASE
ncbi:MAG TPA: F420-0--gamma-glutamyl ligase [Clostridiaceae bacterium]|nr:F420-0--gamma-glutamyl ligase [Clostridiaceae bacterium]